VILQHLATVRNVRVMVVMAPLTIMDYVSIPYQYYPLNKVA
jgi:hypothetical protein